MEKERQDVQDYFCKNFFKIFSTQKGSIGPSLKHHDTLEYKTNLSNIFLDKRIDKIILKTYPKDDRIRYINSSALLCVLAFYKLKSIDLSLIEGYQSFIIKNLSFEKTLGLGLHGRPPGIDLFIECENDTSIFIESKCAEYLSSINGKLSNQYYTLIEKIFNYSPLWSYFHFDENRSCSIYSNEENYYEGLKQMICHLLGVIKYAEDYPEKHIILGEIMYKFDDDIDPNGLHWERYDTLYQSFTKVANNYIKTKSLSNIKIIPRVLSYQDIFKLEVNKKQLNPLVQALYSL